MDGWLGLAERILAGARLDRDEALSILRAPDDDLLEILAAAFRLRRDRWGRGVKLHVLENARAGGCSEDCAFCAQSAAHGAPAAPARSAEEIAEGAREALRAGAYRYCIVTAGAGPTEAVLETVCAAARTIRAETPLRICASLGRLTEAEARRLAAAGVDRFNHNLETSERRFRDLVTTHAWRDRVETVRRARAAGLEICCGGIVGMGEGDEDLVDWVFAVRDLGADSIPVNFLDPRPGTPLEALSRPAPARCLKALALVRFARPAAEIRAAAGRESCLRSLQALALFVADSIFTGGYLTLGGATPDADAALLADAGFHAASPRGDEEPLTPAAAGSILGLD